MTAASRRLLLIGINYAPEETGISPYTTELAEHLVGNGWDVTVVTGMPHYPQWRVLDDYRGSFRSRELLNGVAVQRLRHYVPSHQSAFGRVLYEATFLLQAATTLGLHRPDCVLGIIPSLSGGVAAALHAHRHRVPFGLVVQDLLGQAATQSGIPAGRLAAGPAQAIEGWVLRRAAGVAVVADSFRPYLERAGVPAERVSTLPNWTHLPAPTERWRDLRREFGWGHGETVVLHAGNMGYKQNLDNVISAAHLAADDRFRFVLLGHGTERPRLETLAAGLANVQFLDLQPADLFIDVLAAADILLVNERPTVLDMSLPSKVTSYFRAGRPVVAAVHPEGATSKALEDSGGALLVPAGDPTALLQAIRCLAGDQALQQRLASRCTAHGIASFDRGASLKRAEAFAHGLVSQGENASDAVGGAGVSVPLLGRRRQRAALGRRPDFVVIGAQKSASTSLALALNQHRDVYIPPGETVYFRDPEYHRDSPDDFLRLFAGKESLRRLGIKHADYLARPECPARLHHDLAEPKIIVVLRNPVHRAVSAYFWYMRWNCLPLAPLEVGLPKILAGDYSSDSYPRAQEVLEWGLYEKHLSRYFDLFPAEKIFVALDFEFATDGAALLRQAFEFLDVNPAAAAPPVADRHNTGVYSLPRLEVLRRRNQDYVPLESARTAMTIRRPRRPMPLIRSGALSALDRTLLARRYENRPPALPRDLEEQLRDFYADDIVALEKLLGRDLSCWTTNPSPGSASPTDRP